MKIVIPGMIPPSPNVLKRKYRNPHAYARLRDTWQQAIACMVTPHDRKVLWDHGQQNKMVVKMTFYNSREYDPDNLVGAQKPVLDALKNLGYIHDDSSDWLLLLSPKWARTPRKFSKTEIEIAPTFDKTDFPVAL